MQKMICDVPVGSGSKELATLGSWVSEEGRNLFFYAQSTMTVTSGRRGISLREIRVQELCESRGGRPGLFVLMSLTVSVDVKQH